MPRPVLVGERPGPNCSPKAPLYPIPHNSAGGRLCRMCGLSAAEYLATYDRVNLIPHVGRVWNATLARAMAQNLHASLLRQRHVVLMGRRVAHAFLGKFAYEWMSWYNLPGANYAVVPHPSGHNRWYDDGPNIKAVVKFLRELTQEAREE